MPRVITIDQLITAPAPLLARMTGKPAPITPNEFVDLLTQAGALLASSTLFESASDDLTATAGWMAEAMRNDISDQRRAVLIRRANRHLNAIDPTDY